MFEVCKIAGKVIAVLSFFNRKPRRQADKTCILLKRLVESSMLSFEPLREKTCLRGFQTVPTQAGPYNHRRCLEARNF